MFTTPVVRGFSNRFASPSHVSFIRYRILIVKFLSYILQELKIETLFGNLLSCQSTGKRTRKKQFIMYRKGSCCSSFCFVHFGGPYRSKGAKLSAPSNRKHNRNLFLCGGIDHEQSRDFLGAWWKSQPHLQAITRFRCTQGRSMWEELRQALKSNGLRYSIWLSSDTNWVSELT